MKQKFGNLLKKYHHHVTESSMFLFRRSLVVLLSDPDLLVHGQPGGLPHHREDGHPHLVSRGPGLEQDQVWLHQHWLNCLVLSRLKLSFLQENVEKHGCL